MSENRRNLAQQRALFKLQVLQADLFLLAATTLMVELIETRLLSVMMWYHLAFFVISSAMFGMTAGALWMYLRDRLVRAMERAEPQVQHHQRCTTGGCHRRS